MKFGHVVHTYNRFSILQKFSLQNGHVLLICESYFSQMFPLYGIICCKLYSVILYYRIMQK